MRKNEDQSINQSTNDNKLYQSLKFDSGQVIKEHHSLKLVQVSTWPWFYVNPWCLCASHHRQLTGCANDALGDASHFPGAFRIPTQTRKSHSCPLLLSPYSCAMSFETKWQAEMSCWYWRTYQLTFWQNHGFFSFYRSNRIVIQKNPVCRDMAWKGEVSTRVTWLWCSNSPIQAHPGPSRPHHHSFPDFLIDFGAPPKNKSCHASFPSSIYMPKSGRKFSWIKPPDFRDSTFFWMSIKWMTNLPPLFVMTKRHKKKKL